MDPRLMGGTPPHAGRIVAAAREWIGTRFRHQGRGRDGIDCAGLIIVVAREIGAVAAEFDVTGYGRRPDGRSLLAYCMRYLEAITPPVLAPGTIGLFRIDADPQHLAIIASHQFGGLSMIHAYAPARMVVENRIDGAWFSRLIGAFKYRVR